MYTYMFMCKSILIKTCFCCLPMMLQYRYTLDILNNMYMYTYMYKSILIKTCFLFAKRCALFAHDVTIKIHVQVHIRHSEQLRTQLQISGVFIHVWGLWRSTTQFNALVAHWHLHVHVYQLYGQGIVYLLTLN